MKTTISFFELKGMKSKERSTLHQRTEADLSVFLDGVKPIIEKMRKA